MVFEPNWQNRDKDTHLDIVHDLGYDREDLRPRRELANWEKDLIISEFEPDLES